MALIKNSLFAAFIHQPWGVVVLLVLAALSSLVRGKPAATALWAAPAVALLAGPSSVPAGIALGIGTFALLIALFLAIGTALRLAEARP